MVTLTGYVRDFFHKYGAEEAVKRVTGVVAIANDIQVQTLRPALVSDPELARAAVADPPSSVAEQPAWSAPGVRSVRNQLTVQVDGPTDHDGGCQIRIDPNGARCDVSGTVRSDL